MNRKLLVVCLAAASFLLPSVAGAAVSGPCVDCHTMHNSQNGASVTGGAANDQLLAGDQCVGCHATGVGNVAGTGVAVSGAVIAPLVDDPANTNAGGYFIKTDQTFDSQQHNVADITVMTGDDNLFGTGAPGGGSFSTTDAGSPTLTCQ